VRTKTDIQGNEQNLRYFSDLYGASIDYLDRVLVDFLDILERAVDRETTVIITADHGEELGTEAEDRRIGHLGSLGEGLLHVPCQIVNPPAGWEPADDGYFSHLDLGQLVQSLVAETEPDITSDRAVAEIVGGMSEDFEAPLTNEEFDYWNRMQRCAYDGTRKIVWDSMGNATAYEPDWDDDCSERRLAVDVDTPSWYGDLFDIEIAKYKRQARKQEVDDERIDGVTESRLSDLGYL
jgi:arylsulfatase A-like enzyme